MMQHRRFLFLLAAGLLLGLPSAAWSQITIDDFSSTNYSSWPLKYTTVAPSLMGPTETGLTGTLGGNRTTLLAAPAMDLEGLDEVQVRVFVSTSSSVFDYASTAGAEGAFRLAYTFAPTDFSGQDQVVFNLVSFDLPGPPQPFTVTFNSGASSVSWDGLISQSGAQSVILPFHGHVASWSNLNAVDGMSIEFSSIAKCTDMRIDEILVTVPEPATMGLLGSGLAMLLASRRRKR